MDILESCTTSTSRNSLRALPSSMISVKKSSMPERLPLNIPDTPSKVLPNSPINFPHDVVRADVEEASAMALAVPLTLSSTSSRSRSCASYFWFCSIRYVIWLDISSDMKIPCLLSLVMPSVGDSRAYPRLLMAEPMSILKVAARSLPATKILSKRSVLMSPIVDSAAVASMIACLSILRLSSSFDANSSIRPAEVSALLPVASSTIPCKTPP